MHALSKCHACRGNYLFLHIVVLFKSTGCNKGTNKPQRPRVLVKSGNLSGFGGQRALGPEALGDGTNPSASGSAVVPQFASTPCGSVLGNGGVALSSGGLPEGFLGRPHRPLFVGAQTQTRFWWSCRLPAQLRFALSQFNCLGFRCCLKAFDPLTIQASLLSFQSFGAY